jgi:hypothetical protein
MNPTENHHQSTAPRLNRTGAATIEFVFALPFLLMLMICLTWLGFSMLAQSEVDLTARHQAWQQRYENSNAAPLIFATNPIYERNNDFVGGESEQTVDVSPLFRNVANPRSESSVLSGVWDHRELPLDEFPNWKTYGKAVINAKTGDLQNLLAGMTNFKQIIGDVGRNSLADQLNQLTNIFGKSNSATAAQTQVQNQNQQSQATEKQGLLVRQAELKAAIVELEGENPLKKPSLNSQQERKLFRLKAELSDVEIYLRELG